MTHFFDEFSKAVGERSIPRRETLRRLGLVVTAGVLGPLGMEHARAGKPQADPCKAFCKCSQGRQQDQCVKACKACNNSPSRLAGTCGNYYCCGTGQVSCGGYCADTANDTNNCGACGSVCAPPGPNEYVACTAGKCVYACYDGAVHCDGECTYLNSDPNSCGACGNVCGGSTPYCSYGVCAECPSGYAKCGDSCVDLLFDQNNCGACGYDCGWEASCYWGYCMGNPGYGGGGYYWYYW